MHLVSVQSETCRGFSLSRERGRSPLRRRPASVGNISTLSIDFLRQEWRRARTNVGRGWKLTPQAPRPRSAGALLPECSAGPSPRGGSRWPRVLSRRRSKGAGFAPHILRVNLRCPEPNRNGPEHSVEKHPDPNSSKGWRARSTLARVVQPRQTNVVRAATDRKLKESRARTRRARTRDENAGPPVVWPTDSRMWPQADRRLVGGGPQDRTFSQALDEPAAG